MELINNQCASRACQKAMNASSVWLEQDAILLLSPFEKVPSEKEKFCSVECLAERILERCGSRARLMKDQM